MSNVPAGLKYSDQHEWLKLEGDVATVGITDYAQGALGDLVYVELPAVGRKVKVKEAFVVVESVKAASDVYAPLDGEVVEVNSALSAAPDSVNSSPYDAGWLCKIRVSDAAQVSELLDADAYKKLVA